MLGIVGAPILLVTILAGFHPVAAPESQLDRAAETPDRIQAADTGPPLGEYSCYITSYSIYTGGSVRPIGIDFTLLADGKYKWSGEAGEYSYDFNTTEINWVSGPLVKMGLEFKFKYEGLRSSVYTIILTRDGKPSHTLSARLL
jgi:hypothetical protein